MFAALFYAHILHSLDPSLEKCIILSGQAGRLHKAGERAGSNYTIIAIDFGQSLLRHPWEQRKYPPQFVNGCTIGKYSNMITHLRLRHCKWLKSPTILYHMTGQIGGRPHSSRLVDN